MTPLQRAIEAINTTAIVRDIAGDPEGVVGSEPFWVVINPEDVARAVIQSIRPVTPSQQEAVRRMLARHEMHMSCGIGDVWWTMIDVLLEESK